MNASVGVCITGTHTYTHNSRQTRLATRVLFFPLSVQSASDPNQNQTPQLSMHVKRGALARLRDLNKGITHWQYIYIHVRTYHIAHLYAILYAVRAHLSDVTMRRRRCDSFVDSHKIRSVDERRTATTTAALVRACARNVCVLYTHPCSNTLFRHPRRIVCPPDSAMCIGFRLCIFCGARCLDASRRSRTSTTLKRYADASLRWFCSSMWYTL